jgi:hypothetical protein
MKVKYHLTTGAAVAAIFCLGNYVCYVNVDNQWIEMWISNSRGSDKLKIMLSE